MHTMNEAFDAAKALAANLGTCIAVRKGKTWSPTETGVSSSPTATLSCDTSREQVRSNSSHRCVPRGGAGFCSSHSRCARLFRAAGEKAAQESPGRELLAEGPGRPLHDLS